LNTICRYVRTRGFKIPGSKIAGAG
jgi:hypothetical protein